MASTWSSLKIQLMGAGDEGGTWGTVTNANLGTVIEEAITGSSNVTFASADVTLTLTDTTASQTARNLRLNLTGTTGGARNLIVPAIEKVYIVNNGCADAVTVKNSTGSGIAVPAGKTMYVFNNGTDVVDAITHLTSLTVAGTMTAANVAGDGSAITGLNASNISSGTLANARTTASSSNGASTIVTRDASGNFSANTITATLSGNANNVSGIVAVANGGTGASDAATARANLGAGTGNGTVTSVATSGSVNGLTLTGGTITTTGTITLGGSVNASTISTGILAIANGGTGAGDASGARSNLGLGSLATLSSVGTSQIDNSAVTPGKLSQPFTTGTASATTSGTSVDITGIPSWARKITVILNAVSTSGSSNVLIQIGDSGGIENTGYATTTTWCVFNTNLQSTGSSTAGWAVATNNDASYLTSGILTLCNVSGDTWIGSGSCNQQTVAMNTFAGSKTLSATLDRIRITTANGTDTFDAGSINIMYQ